MKALCYTRAQIIVFSFSHITKNIIILFFGDEEGNRRICPGQSLPSQLQGLLFAFFPGRHF